jgi:hypothetical protein
VEVDLPRPRPVAMPSHPRAVELAGEIRSVLTSADALELRPWADEPEAGAA